MIIKVKVIPNSKKEEIKKISEGEYSAHLKEKAEKGKANSALIRILAGEFNVNSKDIRIKNPMSRKKIIEIDRR